MRIIAITTLKPFFEQSRHRTAEPVIKTWIVVTKAAVWTSPIAVKADFGQTDILQNGRVIFDLGGNRFRLVTKINDRAGIVFIRFIGTQAEYDKSDAGNIEEAS